MKKSYEIDMVNGPLLGKMLLFAVPLMLSGVLHLLFNAADIIVVGQFSGSQALAAVGSTSALINLLVNVFMGLSIGANVLTARYVGARDEAELSDTVHTAITVSLISGAALIFIGVLLAEPLLLLMGTPEDVIGQATLYMQIYFAGMPVIMLYNFGSAILRAVGDTKRPLYFLLIAGCVNVVLNLFFVIVLHMGVAGVALATVISQCISCLWVLLFLRGEKTILRLKKENMRLEAGVILPCLALGLAAFIMQSSESIISVSFNTSLLKYGGDIAVGAMTILSSINMFAMLPLQGLGQGAQPIVSYNYGAKDAGRVRGAFKLLLRSSLIYAGALWLIIMLFPQAFTGLFTPNAELAAFTQAAMRRYFAVMFMFGIQVACQMTFTAIGSARSSIAVAVVRKFVLLLPLIYLMPALFPADKAMAVYLAEPAADFIAVTFTAILFSVQFKKAIEKLPNS